MHTTAHHSLLEINSKYYIVPKHHLRGRVTGRGAQTVTGAEDGDLTQLEVGALVVFLCPPLSSLLLPLFSPPPGINYIFCLLF